MSIRDIIDGKRQWRSHRARVDALPRDYRIVYQELQKYFFKVGSVELTTTHILGDLLDFFEQGVADGKQVRELVGQDVAAFADDLLRASHPVHSPGRG